MTARRIVCILTTGELSSHSPAETIADSVVPCYGRYEIYMSPSDSRATLEEVTELRVDANLVHERSVHGVEDVLDRFDFNILCNSIAFEGNPLYESLLE